MPTAAVPFVPKAVPPKVAFPLRVPRNVPMRPSAQTPVTWSKSGVCTRTTDSHPRPITVNSDSQPWMPYQNRSGCVGSTTQGEKVSQPTTSPIEPFRTAVVAAANRRADELTTGTFIRSASR